MCLCQASPKRPSCWEEREKIARMTVVLELAVTDLKYSSVVSRLMLITHWQLLWLFSSIQWSSLGLAFLCQWSLSCIDTPSHWRHFLWRWWRSGHFLYTCLISIPNDISGEYESSFAQVAQLPKGVSLDRVKLAIISQIIWGYCKVRVGVCLQIIVLQSILFLTHDNRMA